MSSTCSQTNAVLLGSVKIPCYDLVCYFLALPKQKVLCKTNLVTAAVLSLTCLSVNTFHCSPRVMKIAQSSILLPISCYCKSALSRAWGVLGMIQRHISYHFLDSPWLFCFFLMLHFTNCTHILHGRLKLVLKTNSLDLFFSVCQHSQTIWVGLLWY